MVNLRDLVKFGQYVHFHTMNCEPADLWGVVSFLGGKFIFVDMIDGAPGEREYVEWEVPDDHLTLYDPVPDEFYVWRAKRALLNDLTN